MQPNKFKENLTSNGALFGVLSGVRIAYEKGDKKQVTNKVIDILVEHVPEDELKYIVSYLNDRIYE